MPDINMRAKFCYNIFAFGFFFVNRRFFRVGFHYNFGIGSNDLFVRVSSFNLSAAAEKNNAKQKR